MSPKVSAQEMEEKQCVRQRARAQAEGSTASLPRQSQLSCGLLGTRILITCELYNSSRQFLGSKEKSEFYFLKEK